MIYGGITSTVCTESSNGNDNAPSGSRSSASDACILFKLAYPQELLSEDVQNNEKTKGVLRSGGGNRMDL